MKRRILIVEDEPAIADNIVFALGTEGFETIWHSNGEQVLSVLSKEPVDLIILDIGLPDINGMELCKEIRKNYTVPIIFLTARSDEIDRVVGLEIGADDYMVKPFSHIELIARVEAVLRRSRGIPASSDDRPYTSGNLSVNFVTNEVKVGGKPVKLTSTEMKLLRHLIRNEGRLLTHENLLSKVWGEGYQDTRDLLRVHIQHLRQKLGDSVDSPKIIITEHGMGYRFVRQDNV